MKKQDSNNIIVNEDISQKLRELVLERLKRMPEDMEMSIGDLDYSKTELLNHVSEGDEIGKEVVNMQIEFLQDLASGSIYTDE